MSNAAGDQVEAECKTTVSESSSKCEPNNDPYAYLERDEFTSEKFKIEIRGLPKYYGLKELKKLLNEKLKLNSTKIKIPQHRSPWIYVCFRSEEDKATALKVLNNYEWRHCCLKAEEAKPIPDPLVQKRIQKSNENEPANKKAKVESTLVEKLRDATTPLWRLPYEQQLVKKRHLIRDLMNRYVNSILSANPCARKWLEAQKSKFDGMPCEILPIRHAEVIDGYRNKCEFSIGINEDTGEKTIGFRLSSYVKGSVSVAPIDEALNVPDIMKKAVISFQKFIRNSDLDVFSPELHKGYWQQLTARCGFRTNQLMLIVGICPQNMTVENLNRLKNIIKEYFKEGEGKSCEITSFYLQQMKRKKSQDDETICEHVFGETYITERLLGRTFRISPKAFFQVNTEATEILYQTIGELAGLTSDMTLLDVYCGTGSIGISLSDKCGEVLGLEISADAIADAKVNAEKNNVLNAQFFTGKAEEILSCVALKATKSDIVAVVDPPRAGLQSDALVQLRNCENIKKLIYVSCNPRSAVQSFVSLGRARSKLYRGDPFLPVKAVSVDLFPYTSHCELVIYFERNPDC